MANTIYLELARYNKENNAVRYRSLWKGKWNEGLISYMEKNEKHSIMLSGGVNTDIPIFITTKAYERELEKVRD